MNQLFYPPPPPAGNFHFPASFSSEHPSLLILLTHPISTAINLYSLYPTHPWLSLPHQFQFKLHLPLSLRRILHSFYSSPFTLSFLLFIFLPSSSGRYTTTIPISSSLSNLISLISFALTIQSNLLIISYYLALNRLPVYFLPSNPLIVIFTLLRLFSLCSINLIVASYFPSTTLLSFVSYLTLPAFSRYFSFSLAILLVPRLLLETPASFPSYLLSSVFRVTL